MKKIYLLAFVISFCCISANIFSQRCGDGIWLSFNKSGNKFLDSADLKISLKTFDRRFKYYNAPGHTEMSLDTLSDTAAYITYVTEINANISASDSNKIYFPTGCGFFRMEFTLTDQKTSEVIKLIMYKVPHDIPLMLTGISLVPGVYEYNINGKPDPTVFKEDKPGVYSFDISNFSYRKQ